MSRIKGCPYVDSVTLAEGVAVAATIETELLRGQTDAQCLTFFCSRISHVAGDRSYLLS